MSVKRQRGNKTRNSQKMLQWENNEEIKYFREYLRIPSVHPDVNYGIFCLHIVLLTMYLPDHVACLLISIIHIRWMFAVSSSASAKFGTANTSFISQSSEKASDRYHLDWNQPRIAIDRIEFTYGCGARV